MTYRSTYFSPEQEYCNDRAYQVDWHWRPRRHHCGAAMPLSRFWFVDQDSRTSPPIRATRVASFILSRQHRNMTLP